MEKNARIDIDVGGTFTDCVVSSGGKTVFDKSPTTTYDLSVGFKNAVEQCAQRLNTSIEDLLSHTDSITYSTTVAMNTLLSRTGPKLGLFVTGGFEDLIFHGKSRQWADGLPAVEVKKIGLGRKPEPLVTRDMVVGIKERVDCDGRVLISLSRDEVRDKLRYLVDRGAKGFAVCFLWSFRNPDHERIVREVILEEYPETYLGNAPVLLSHEVHPKWGEYQRAMVTVLSAYLHTEMTGQLKGLGDNLRDLGYKRPLNIIHNTGGTAKLTRTRPVDTYQSGPVAGLIGSLFVGEQIGLKNIISTDMGGTSFDIGVISDGALSYYLFRPVIDRWAVDLTMIESKSLGAGGGSIAHLNPAKGNLLEVGPASSGAMPGPACYDLGGSAPTVTDADVVLGYLNPEFFAGGRTTIRKDLAEKAIQEKIAGPLGSTVVEAAMGIKRVVDAKMGMEIYKELSLRGYDPREFTLFAYGGGGPSHCTGYAPYAEVPRVMTFVDAAVFCAYGSAVADIKHTSERSMPLTLFDPETNTYYDNYEEFNSAILEMQEAAIRDVRAEGHVPKRIVFMLEVEARYGTQPRIWRAVCPRLSLQSQDDVKTVQESIWAAFAKVHAGVKFPPAITRIESFILTATVPGIRRQLATYALSHASPKIAFKGKRQAYWEQMGRFEATDIYDSRLLKPGNMVHGPAIIEAETTTYVLPPAWKLSVDKHLIRTLEKE